MTAGLVQLLQSFHNREGAELLAQKIMEGLIIPSTGQGLGQRSRNLKSVEEYTEVAREKVT